MSQLESDYGVDLTEGSTIMRMAISNLISNPPAEKDIQELIIACKNDETFCAFLKKILKD